MSRPAAGSGFGTRALTRFALVYYLLYAVGTQVIENLLLAPSGDYVRKHAWSQFVSWVGVHVFGLAGVSVGEGSNDRLFDWLQLFTFVVMAAVAALIWIAVDRRRSSDVASDRVDARVDAWLRVLLRIALGSVLAFYGTVKVWPVQMAAPSLVQLLQPVGSLSPQDLLWVSVGAVQPYQQFIGVIEVVAACLLFGPRTASLGAVLAWLELSYILVLDVTYGLPVKLWAFQLVVMATILAAPIVPAIRDVLFHRAPRVPAEPAPLFASARLARIAVIIQILLGAYVVGVNGLNARREWVDRDTANVAVAPLYGAWNVSGDAMWRRVVFEHGGAFFQRMDDTFAGYGAVVDRGGGTVTLTHPHDPAAAGVLNFTLPEGGRLVLDGQVDGRAIHLEAQRIDIAAWPLVSHHFHLLQESSVVR